ARGGLATAMGLPANTALDVEEFPNEVPAGEVAEQVDRLIRQALERRPDLAAARAEALAREADARRARSDGLPTVTLNSNADVTFTRQDAATSSGRGEAGASDRAEAALTASVLLQVPLYIGGAIGHRVERARALAEAARENARSLEQQVMLQVFTSYHALRTAAQKVRTSDELLASATQSLNVAEGRYREGVGTTVDVVTAQTALADARAQKVQARLEWYTSLAQLARDAGLLEASGANPLSASASGRSPGPVQEK
ncbi:MAG: TolC family protein, partial [Deltaproteobacteria bacterium]|nr:TolC family protein [Deltaproteobacteria bacterium]